MKITRKEVEHVARLVRLELQPEEVERMTTLLDTILSYAAKLDELDTSGVAVTTHTLGTDNVFRDDLVHEALNRELALANGPDQNGEAFVVPRIIS
ncbi:MAG: Asp-tRNA(Asn)/Glu-tRNA(Gln) amidotransferase subunit GatC [Deltaproteobacteria bacterium]|nr:Asp-tRNA(Asn)/Glu-tRNA(Gln) amidotransferase subunit GatC [Deltaproteobacteria bacterium]